MKAALTSRCPRVGQGEPQGEDDGRQQDVRDPFPGPRGPRHVHRLGDLLLVFAHLQTHHGLRCQWLTCAYRGHASLELENWGVRVWAGHALRGDRSGLVSFCRGYTRSFFNNLSLAQLFQCRQELKLKLLGLYRQSFARNLVWKIL